jgi:hypothetical protein
MKNKILFLFLVAYSTILTVVSCKTQNHDPVIDLKANKIPTSDIVEMIEIYKKDRLQIIESNDSLIKKYGANFKDTKNLWFSLEKLKEFIAQIEYGVEQNNYNVECDGIRMHLVVYPPKTANESDYLKTIPEDYRNQISLIMVPTYFDESTQTSETFDPFDSSVTNEGKLIQKGSAIVFGQGSGGTQTAHNHAALCPPMCPVKTP